MPLHVTDIEYESLTEDPTDPPDGKKWFNSTEGRFKRRVGGVTKVSADSDDPPTAHDVGSHADTSATGPQLDQLVGGGSTTLHTHPGLEGGDPTCYIDPATTEYSLGPTTYDVIDSMSRTPPAGTYLATFTGSIKNSTKGETNFVSIFEDGVQKDGSELKDVIPNGVNTDFNPFVSQAIVTVDGTQAVDVRWKCTGGTMTVAQRTLTLLKVEQGV